MPRRKKAEFECPPNGNYAAGGVPVDRIVLYKGEDAVVAAWPNVLEGVFESIKSVGGYIDWRVKAAVLRGVAHDLELRPEDVYWVKVRGRGTYVVPQCRAKGRTLKVYGIYFYPEG